MPLVLQVERGRETKNGGEKGGGCNDLPSGKGTKLSNSIKSTTGRVENGKGVFIGVLASYFASVSSHVLLCFDSSNDNGFPST